MIFLSDDHGVLELHPIVRPRRKLLLLDLNKICYDTKKFSSANQTHNPFYSHTNECFIETRYKTTYLYRPRPDLHDFLSRILMGFDVAIFTCASRPKGQKMINMLVKKEVREKFKYIFYQEDTQATTIYRNDVLDREAFVLLKDFKNVWAKLGDQYDETNTLLIDDSPMKAFVNPPWTALFPDPFNFDDKEDSFFMNILLPYLWGLERAYDVRCYLLNHSPKWSLLNAGRDMAKEPMIYEVLKAEYADKIWHSSYSHTILDLSGWEIPYDVSVRISQLRQSKKEGTRMEVGEHVHLINRGIGENYSGIYRQNQELFLEHVLERNEHVWKFFDLHTKEGVHRRKMCNRDTEKDWHNYCLTCSNLLCDRCLEPEEWQTICSILDEEQKRTLAPHVIRG